MREEQYQRLHALQEKLLDLAIDEGNPETWTAFGIPVKDLTKDQRGDRYWCKKNAVATFSLTMKVGSLLGMIERSKAPVDDQEGEVEGDGLLDEEIKAAEKEAARMLKKAGVKQTEKAGK